MSNFKERSATGIQYMIEKHTRLEVDICVQPNYVIIPHGGVYLEWVLVINRRQQTNFNQSTFLQIFRNQVPLMVISLGRLCLKTEPRKDDEKDVASMHTSGKASDDILKEIMDQAYDRFNLDIQDIQILFAKPTDNWQEALNLGKISRLHILEPISLQVTAAMCVVDDDPRLPKTRIHAKIPSIGVSVTEEKALDVLSLVTSIPLPAEDLQGMPLTKEGIIASSSMSLKRYLDEKQQRKAKIPEQKQHVTDEEITQYTDLEFSFVLNGMHTVDFLILERIFIALDFWLFFYFASFRIIGKYLPRWRWASITNFTI